MIGNINFLIFYIFNDKSEIAYNDKFNYDFKIDI